MEGILVGKNCIQKPCLGLCEVHYVYVHSADVRAQGADFFCIYVSANTVLSLEPSHRLGYIILLLMYFTIKYVGSFLLLSQLLCFPFLLMLPTFRLKESGN